MNYTIVGDDNNSNFVIITNYFIYIYNIIEIKYYNNRELL